MAKSNVLSLTVAPAVAPTLKIKVSKTKQKEQRIKNFLGNYAIPFDMEDAAIDLRTMAQNYPTGIIPSKDITEAINAVLGAAPIPRLSIDPRNLNIPQFTWAEMDDVGINPIFQRDIAPNHVAKIESMFQADMIIVPCAIKDPVTGKFLLWDGNHTRQVCERMGWTHLPVWYTEAVIDDAHSLAEATKILILKAGRSFLTINKTGKRPCGNYDAHMISVECGDNEAVTVQRIVDANNCQVKRASTKAGDISHIEHLYGAYDLVQASSGIKGIYLSRSLKFHRDTWPKEEVRGIMMLAMARLFQQTEMQGTTLTNVFDVEFGNILKKVYGQSEKVHIRLKEQFEQHFGSLGAHLVVVTSGLVLTYNKHNTKGAKLAQPEATYPVK
jgi:hypothetical protein